MGWPYSTVAMEESSRKRGWGSTGREGMEQAASIRNAGSEQATVERVGAGAVQGRVSQLHSHPNRSSAIAGAQPVLKAAAHTVTQMPKTAEFLIRLLDIIGSLTILVLALPVMIVSSLLIRMTSAGPIFYRQERVGQGGRLFALYKFRTMINDAEKHVGPVWASPNDDRVTPVGRILRKMRLDELPQLFNILRGDMSLVGPRPERPFFVERHKALQGIRLAVKPGLTGLAQVRSYYDLKPTHKVKYDYLYIQKRSVLLNIYILLQTIPVLFAKKGW